MSDTSRGRFPGALRALVLGASTLTIAAIAVSPAHAQSASAKRNFSIAPQPLLAALQQFTEQSGVQVAFSTGAGSGLRSSGVSGDLDPAGALSMLLSGTGLTYRFTSANAVILEPAPQAADGVVQLGTLRVEGGSQGSTGVSGDGSARDSANAPYTRPGSSAHISRAQIDRVPPNSAGDMFRETPGVISGSNYNGTAMDVNIRGSQGMNRVKVLVDGTEQQSSTYRGYAGPDNRSYVDPELVAEIDIEKGPGAGERSAGAIGGVVAMRTLEARDLLSEGETFGGRVRAMIGDNRIGARTHAGILPAAQVDLKQGGRSFISAENWLGSVAAAYRNDSFELVAGYSHRQTGNYFAGNQHGDLTYQLRLFQISSWRTAEFPYSAFKPGSEIPNTSENTESALVKGKFKWGDNMSLELGAVHYETTYGMVFPLRLDFYAPQQYPMSEIESQRYYARYKWNAEDNDLISLTANVWLTDLHSMDSSENPGVPQNSIDGQAWGINATNNSYFSTGIGELKLTYGGEYSEHRMERSVPLANQAPLIDTQGSRKLGGIFTNANLQATPWLTLDAGVRFDWFKTRGASASPYLIMQPVISVGYNNIWGELSSSAVSPSAAVTVTPIDGFQLFAKYARGWRPPSQVETFGSGPNGLKPNPELRPETSNGFEVGANFLRDGLLRDDDVIRAKISYFYNDYKDYIFRSNPNDGRFINYPGAKMGGIEGSASYESGPFFASAQATYYTTNQYCFTPEAFYTRYPEFGFPADRACHPEVPVGDWLGSSVPPKYSGSATLGARLFDKRLTIGGRANFFGKRAGRLPTHNSASNPILWAPTQTFDLFGGYRFSDAVKIDFSVENITDRFYISPLAVARMPSPGRQAKFTFTYDF